MLSWLGLAVDYPDQVGSKRGRKCIVLEDIGYGSVNSVEPTIENLEGFLKELEEETQKVKDYLAVLYSKRNQT